MAKVKKSRKKSAAAMAPVKHVHAVPKKGGVLMAVLAVLVVFTAVEIYIVAQKTIRESKKPDFVTSWPSEYKKGVTSMGEYGNYIYGVDDTTTGNVYKTNKIDGKPVKLFQIPELVYSAVEDSKGEVYILDKQNTVQEFTPENKFKRKIKLDGIQAAAWLEVDPKDNFYIVDSANSVITKFDHDFKPVTHFGGIGEGKTNFTNCGKIYAGPNDTLYCVNMTKADGARVKIMDSRGNFIKEWPVKKMAKFSNLSNLAITRSGFVYINSFEESKVFIFDSNGNFMGSFDTDKNKRFLITYPSSMTGGKNGLLYIATHETAIFRTIAY